MELINNLMNPVETLNSLINDLESLGANLPFLEYYSHTDENMYKILNPYTKYKQDKIVLCSVKHGLLKALEIAVPLIAMKKEKFYSDLYF